MMSREIERRLAEATEEAKNQRHEFVSLEHVLLALCRSPRMVEILEACAINVQQLKKHIQDFLKKNTSFISETQLESYGGFETWTPEFTLACHRLMQRAALQMKSAGKNQINEGTLLVALFYETDSPAVYALAKQGLTQFDVINYISHGITKDGSMGPSNEFLPAALPHSESQAESEEKNNPLESFCVNLNERASQGKIDPLIGREDILERIQQILLRRTKNNPLLIGEPGVGKTAIAEGLAQRIVEGKVPESLKQTVVYSLDLGSLLAGTKFRGDFEGRLKGILKEIKKRKKVILFIDEIHTLVGAGSTSGGSMDASNLLKPALANGDVTCIGSTTHLEYRQHFEKDRALNRRFQKVDINEPSLEDCFQILLGLKKNYETFHNVTYSDEALRSSIELSQKHIHGKLLPDKAIDVIDEAGSFFRMQKQKEQSDSKETLHIRPEEIETVLARMTGLPVAAVSSNEKAQLKDLDKKLKTLIFGQNEAIDRVVASLKMARTGMSRAQKPIGCFIFAGPTGVGKTEVCKQLAQVQGLPFQRFDMSEYMEKHAVARLIGAPPGYVGYESGGLLTEAINKTPYCVLLLDEVEKAHSDILNSLLQVMDAGRLTDGQGRVADFKNVILIMTTNAGALEVSRGNIGLVDDAKSHISLEALKKSFAPEFLNRLDAIVHFKDLSEETLLQVVGKFVDELKMNLTLKNVELNVSTDVLKWILKKGYNRAYGARPLSRTVDEHIKTALVDELLFGRLAEGGRVQVNVEGDMLKFHFSTSPNGTPSTKARKQKVIAN
ncbi:MAG: ATP-dependent Clp protease ATP-binding subunit ClpA [Bdellovibrionota bacterium]